MNTNAVLSFSPSGRLALSASQSRFVRFGQEENKNEDFITLSPETLNNEDETGTQQKNEPSKAQVASKAKKGCGPLGFVIAGFMMCFASVFCRAVGETGVALVNSPFRGAECVEVTSQGMKTDQGKLMGKLFVNGTPDAAEIYENGNIYSCLSGWKKGYIEQKDGVVQVYQQGLVPFTFGRVGHADEQGNIYRRVPGKDIRIGSVSEQNGKYQILTNAGTVVGTIDGGAKGEKLSKAEAAAAGMFAILQEEFNRSSSSNVNSSRR